MVAVGMWFGGCGDDGKSPLIELDSGVLRIYSRDDETIIKKMAIKGRNGEKLPYETMRAVFFGGESCPPKNGKYEVELDTNFGTYYYEIEMANI